MLGTDVARRCLREAVEKVRRNWPFELVAIVLLPDHIHTVWTLPPEDVRYPIRWKRIKEEFTRRYLAAGGEEMRPSLSRCGAVNAAFGSGGTGSTQYATRGPEALRRLRPLEPQEARTRGERPRLALVLVSSLRGSGGVHAGLGCGRPDARVRRSRMGRIGTKTRMAGVGGAWFGRGDPTSGIGGARSARPTLQLPNLPFPLAFYCVPAPCNSSTARRCCGEVTAPCRIGSLVSTRCW